MNIIGGRYRGAKIAMPKGLRVRPTSNKAREALFNILGNIVPGARVLDLFAGSGALGLEALSRGAGSVVLVDNNSRCVGTIKETIEKLNISGDVTLLQLNALQGIKRLEKGAKFDLVILDPPYFKEWVKKVLIYLDQCDIVKNHGFVVCEHHKKEEAPERIGGFRRVRQSVYGDTALSFYKKANHET